MAKIGEGLSGGTVNLINLIVDYILKKKVFGSTKIMIIYVSKNRRRIIEQ